MEIGKLKLIENEFEKILNDMLKDNALKEFKTQFEKLYDAMVKSHNQERDLTKNIKDLEVSLNKNSGKIREVLEVAQEDAEVISNLKNELNEVRGILTVHREKDEESRTKVENLTKMWKNLEGIVEENQTNNMGKINEYQEMVNSKVKSQAIIDQIATEIATLAQTVSNLDIELGSVECSNQGLKAEFDSLITNNLKIKNQLKKSEERLAVAGEESDIMRKNITLLKNEFGKQKQEIKQLERDLTEMNYQVTKFKAKNEASLIRNQDLMDAKLKCSHELQEQRSQTEILRQERDQVESDVKALMKQSSIVYVRENQLERDVNKLVFFIKEAKIEHDDLERTNEALISNIGDFNLKIKNLSKDTESNKEILKQLSQNIEIVNEKVNEAQKINEKGFAEFNKQRNEQLQLQGSLNPLREQLAVSEENVKEQRKIKESILKKINNENSKINKLNEELNNLNNIIGDFQKQINELEKTLVDQQKLYESVRSERNNYTKNLSDTQDQMAEIKKRLKILNQQIDQLKEEFEVKEKAVTMEINKNANINKKIEQNEIAIEKLKHERELINETIGELIRESERIKKTKNLIDKEFEDLQRQYTVAFGQRDSLGTNLVRKNDEIALVNEKIIANEESSKKGEATMTELEMEFRFMKNILNDMKKNIKTYIRKNNKLVQWTKEIEQWNLKLMEEKIKVKAFSEELENPLNSVRWRLVGGFEQDTFELLKKIESVQKRLIFKTQEIIECELEIASQEENKKNMIEIKNKNPGLEEALLLSSLQKDLRSKTMKAKALAAELNMYRFKNKEIKSEFNSTREKIQEQEKRILLLENKRVFLPNI